MFGNKDYITPDQLTALLAPMEERIAQMEKQMEKLQRDMKRLQRESGMQPQKNSSGEAPMQPGSPCPATDPPVIGINMDRAEAFAPQAATVGREAQRIASYYLQAPSADGMFTLFSEQEQIGKSIYLLTSKDGLNGTFILIDSPDAIATAMISVSQFVKPVCKVIGNTHQLPRHIVTVEEGVAQREAEGWRVIRKAVVRFE